MNLQERKDILLKHSAHEVRNSRTLFAEFVFIYTSEGGKESDCMSCNFKTVYNRWQQNIITNVKKTENMDYGNTFKLKNEKKMIYVPNNGDVISKGSPDSLVEEYLNQEGGKYKQVRIDAYFEVLPESMRVKSEKVEKTGEVSETDEKPAPKKRTSKKK